MPAALISCDPIGRCASAVGSGALEPPRPVGARAAGDFDLSAADQVIAARAVPSIVERFPFCVRIELPERIEFVFEVQPEGS